MECLKGKSVYKGIALGKISVLKKTDYVVKRTKVESAEEEIERVNQAKELACGQLQNLYEKAFERSGRSECSNF